MKKTVIILGFISAVLAVILTVTPLSQIAFIPSIIALIFGAIAMYLSKQKQGFKKTIQLMFLLTIIALVVTTYKSVFNSVEVGNTEALEIKETESQEQAIEELEDLDIDELDFE